MFTFRNIKINLKKKIIILSEVSQTEKDKYHMTPLECGIFFKKERDTNEFIYQTVKNSHT